VFYDLTKHSREYLLESIKGLVAEVEVAPSNCPVATLSERLDDESIEVKKVSKEGAVHADLHVPPGSELPDALPVKYSSDSGKVLKFDFEPERDCICLNLEDSGFVLNSIEALDGNLVFKVFLEDRGSLKEFLSSIDEEVRLRKAAKEMEPDGSGATKRQLEVLRTAYEKGYFDYPKRANAGEVAESLGISTPTFVQHLSRALSKVLADQFPGAEGRGTAE